MIITGLARLGRDASLKVTPSGDSILEMALAFNYGKKDHDGNRPTQWINATLFGKRAEALHQYLKKGTQVNVVIVDPHIQTWKKKDDSTGFGLHGNVSELEFAGGGSSREEPLKPEPKLAPVDDFNDEIPF